MLADIGLYDCTGSSSWELSGDHVITRIFGPEGVKSSKENVNQALLEVEIHSEPGSKNKDALLQSFIKKTFEKLILLYKYPKTLVMDVMIEGD